MPRGSNPNSKKALKENRTKTQFNGERAVKAGKNSGKVRGVFKSLNEDLRERLTPELIAEINDHIISLVKSDNSSIALKAYEIIRNGIGEDPAKKVELTGANGGTLKVRWMDRPDEVTSNG